MLKNKITEVKITNAGILGRCLTLTTFQGLNFKQYSKNFSEGFLELILDKNEISKLEVGFEDLECPEENSCLNKAEYRHGALPKPIQKKIQENLKLKEIFYEGSPILNLILRKPAGHSNSLPDRVFDTLVAEPDSAMADAIKKGQEEAKSAQKTGRFVPRPKLPSIHRDSAWGAVVYERPKPNSGQVLAQEIATHRLKDVTQVIDNFKEKINQVDDNYLQPTPVGPESLITWLNKSYYDNPILTNINNFLTDPIGQFQAFCSRYNGLFQYEKTVRGPFGRVNLTPDLQNKVKTYVRKNGEVSRILTGSLGEVACIDLLFNMVLEGVGLKTRLKTKNEEYTSKFGKIGDGGIDLQIHDTFFDVKTRSDKGKFADIAIKPGDLQKNTKTIFIGTNLSGTPSLYGNPTETIVAYIPGCATTEMAKKSPSTLASGSKLVEYPDYLSFDKLLQCIVVLAAVQEQVIKPEWLTSIYKSYVI